MYSSASAVMACRPSGVTQIDIQGLVTPTVLQQLRDDMLVHVQRPLWAWDVRLERATFAVTAGQLDALSYGARAGSPLAACAAVVVNPGSVELFRAHARSMAERGIGRVVFTSPAEARKWSEEQARLWKAQAEWEHRQSTAARPRLLSAG